MKILIVEDNKLFGESMSQGLSEAGWTVDLALDGEEGLYMVENCSYDLLLIDRLLPKMSGTILISELRKKNIHTPIIMVTALGELQDRVDGLNEGADDYLVKPVELSELLARVRALHRRAQGRVDQKIKLARLEINIEKRQVCVKGEQIELTTKEFDFLASLAGKSGRVFNRDEIRGLLYKFDAEPESNSIDVLLMRVRKKISNSGIEIATIRGKGFVLRVAETSA